MPNPSITPALPGNNSYIVSGSRQAWLDLTIDVDNLGETAEFTLNCPESTTVTLFKGAAILGLSTSSTVNDNGVTFAAYNVTADGSAAGGNASIGVVIEPNAPPVNEVWRVRLVNTSTANYTVIRGANTTIERVIADPMITVSPLTTVFERDTIVLSGTAAYTRVTTGVGTLVPVPNVRARWSQVSGSVAAAPPPTIFNGPSNVAASVNFTSPSLYRSSESVTYRLTGFYDENNNNTGDISEPVNTADVSLTIEPRQRHMLLLLDRSGSMTATMPGSVPPISRWEFARRAAHVWADLWIALRGSVNPEDKAGIMIFESNVCGWGNPGGPIEVALPPNQLGGVDALNVATLSLGNPGSCTPIGDALISAIDTFVAAEGTPDATYTLLTMTDGYENSGVTVVEDDSPIPAGAAARFAQERIKPARLVVSDRLTMYTCGLGTPATVQESVLHDLPNTPGAGNPTDLGIYNLVQDNELLSTFTEMLTHALDAQLVAPFGPPANPLADLNAIYVPMAGDHRAVFVAQWTSSLDHLSVFFRPQGSVSWTQVSGVGIGTPPAGVTYFRRSHHGLVAVDLRALLGDPPADTEWAIVHQPGGGASQAISADRFVALADLVVKADISFDRTFYRTNHTARITCNLTAAGEPISSARIRVELARPGESLGTFLATNGQKYRPSQPGGDDPLAPKAAMVQALIRQTEQKNGELPVIRPAIIFSDGTNELWDDGKHRDGAERDGVFANAYTRLDQEGTYVWRFFIEGRTPNGGYFNRLLTRSIWVGIGVDPRATKVDLNYEVFVQGGQNSVQIIVLPADRRGQLLGPFRASDVQIGATGGQFLGSSTGTPVTDDGVIYPQPDGGDLISHYDGRYSRVLLFNPGDTLEVRIVIQGRRFDPIVVP